MQHIDPLFHIPMHHHLSDIRLEYIYYYWLNLSNYRDIYSQYLIEPSLRSILPTTTSLSCYYYSFAIRNRYGT